MIACKVVVEIVDDEIVKKTRVLNVMLREIAFKTFCVKFEIKKLLKSENSNIDLTKLLKIVKIICVLSTKIIKKTLKLSIINKNVDCEQTLYFERKIEFVFVTLHATLKFLLKYTIKR